tara:strand:- start:164 stop:325 length:162 start_codon:yes stop_codon:yes gene_type:complete
MTATEAAQIEEVLRLARKGTFVAKTLSDARTFNEIVTITRTLLELDEFNHTTN